MQKLLIETKESTHEEPRILFDDANTLCEAVVVTIFAIRSWGAEGANLRQTKLPCGLCPSAHR